MHAIPEKLSALRQSLEATMIRQNVETRQEFEKKLRDACKDAEDVALQRAEELIVPQMRATSERLQGLIHAVQMRAEEAFPKCAELQEQLNTCRSEVQPLYQRADAAAARLDRVAVEASTTSKDCLDLNQDFKEVVADLRARLAEETKRREDMGDMLKALIASTSQEANRATQVVSDKADDQSNSIIAQMGSLDERLTRRLDETGARITKEWKDGDDQLNNRLRLDIQAISNLVQKRSDENQEHAEGIVRNAVSTLRGELDSTSKNLSSTGDRNLEQKARDLIARMNEGFEAANRRTENVREGSSTALHEACAVLRKDVVAVRNGLGNEAQTLRQLIANAETRTAQALDEYERKTMDASSKRLQDTATDLRREADEQKKMLLDGDESLRQALNGQMDEAVAKLEQKIHDTDAANSGSSGLAIGQAMTQLQSELAAAMKTANERIDTARATAADALNKEVLARQQALAAAQAGRDALNMNLREEIKSATGEALRSSNAVTNKVDRRLDTAMDALKNLERTLEAVSKDHSDTTASLRKQLKSEREQTEVMGTERLQFTQEVRDNFEAHLQNVAAELRQGLADARKKIYEESNTLRAELREQPTKRELVELASTTTEQYNELNNTLASHRVRLEAAVDEQGAKVRDARSEFSEARLRMQRETMALGGELTTLRNASSSLANGVLKALQVIGFVRDEIEVASGKESKRADGSEGDSKNEHRGLEICDLLEWEKVGKSLATRIARQWYVQESAGIPNILSLVERKADTEELVILKTLIKENAPNTFRDMMNQTASTMYTSPSPPLGMPSLPPSPKPGSPPPAIANARQQRMIGSP